MDWVKTWLWGITGVVPPLCVEVVLRDGARHYLHSVLERDDETGTGLIRIWDPRAFTDRDIEDLKVRLYGIQDRADLRSVQQVHPKLDWANVYLHVDAVAHCIEWHDRLWPEEERPKIGFR